MTDNDRPRTHFVPEYFLNPVHPITIDLVGCGGNGSMMLSCLASIDLSLRALEYRGISVTAYDPDVVETPNIGRQLFNQNDLGCNKADALITRFNRIFGLDWKAVPEKYKYDYKTNIIISCTDNTASRKKIGQSFAKANASSNTVGQAKEFMNYYWLDLGNTKSTGQAILGSNTIEQPNSAKFETVEKLPCVTELYKLTQKDDENSGPSCSLAEALDKQDLFINRSLAIEAADIIWKLLRNNHIEHHGFFKNMDEFRTVPIPV